MAETLTLLANGETLRVRLAHSTPRLRTWQTKVRPCCIQVSPLTF